MTSKVQTVKSDVLIASVSYGDIMPRLVCHIEGYEWRTSPGDSYTEELWKIGAAPRPETEDEYVNRILEEVRKIYTTTEFFNSVVMGKHPLYEFLRHSYGQAFIVDTHPDEIAIKARRIYRDELEEYKREIQE